MLVQDRQQRQADAGLAGGGDEPLAQLHSIRVRPAVRIVMDVVELAHRGVAALEHLDVDAGWRWPPAPPAQAAARRRT